MSKSSCFIHILINNFSSHKSWDFFPEVGPFQNKEHQVFRLCFNIQTDTPSKSIKNWKSSKIHKKITRFVSSIFHIRPWFLPKLFQCLFLTGHLVGLNIWTSKTGHALERLQKNIFRLVFKKNLTYDWVWGIRGGGFHGRGHNSRLE